MAKTKTLSRVSFTPAYALTVPAPPQPRHSSLLRTGITGEMVPVRSRGEVCAEKDETVIVLLISVPDEHQS